MAMGPSINPTAISGSPTLNSVSRTNSTKARGFTKCFLQDHARNGSDQPKTQLPGCYISFIMNFETHSYNYHSSPFNRVSTHRHNTLREQQGQVLQFL